MARLPHDIEEELASEPNVDDGAIGVAVEDGVVTLSGHIASHAEKVAAERAATPASLLKLFLVAPASVEYSAESNPERHVGIPQDPIAV